MRRMYSLAALLMLLASCSGGESADTQPPVSEDPAFEMGESEVIDSFEHPPVNLPPKPRIPTRLRVAELDQSIQVVAGDWPNGTPIDWRYFWVDVLEYDVFGSTLGMTDDFGDITSENTEITPLYVKYMDDMGRHVCSAIQNSDAQKPQEERTLTRFIADPATATDAEIDQNLRYLSLRFHGEYVPSTDTDGIADIRAVYDAVAQSSDEATAWYVVCSALFLSPAFHVY